MFFRFAAIFVALAAYLLQPYSGTSSRAKGYMKSGSWAIVLGGSDGLGEAWARQLASHGLNLVLVARRRAPLEHLARNLQDEHPGLQVSTVVGDLSAATAEWLANDVLLDHDVRVLVYNAAATGPKGDFLEGNLSDSHVAVDVNVRGIVTATHTFGRYLKMQGTGGAIVLMSSLAGEVGTAWVANYAASKAYITAFALGIGNELAAGGIDVLSCIAGATVTPTYLRSLGDVSTRKHWIEQEPADVVSECLAGLGRTSAVVTGSINKAAQFFFTRLLPRDLAVRVFSQQTGQQMGFGPTS